MRKFCPVSGLYDVIADFVPYIAVKAFNLPSKVFTGLRVGGAEDGGVGLGVVEEFSFCAIMYCSTKRYSKSSTIS